MSWNNQSRSVEITQVVTEPELVERSSQLEAALSQPQFGPYCQAKAEAASQPSDQVSICVLPSVKLCYTRIEVGRGPTLQPLGPQAVFGGVACTLTK